MNPPPGDEPVDPYGSAGGYRPRPAPSVPPQAYGPPPGYGAPAHGPSAAAPPPGGNPSRPTFTQRMGPRLARRPEPRFGVALAAVGVALTIFGILVLGSANDFAAGHGGRYAIGIVLSVVTIAVGYAILQTRRDGPLSTAGVAASALGVPVLLGFVTSAASAGPTTAINVVILFSVVAWLVSYVGIPGAQGHVFYLGAATVTLWFWVVYSVNKAALVAVFLLPFVRVNAVDGSDSTGGGFSFDGGPPDFNALATVSILIGVVYYAAAFLLDHTGRAGLAVAFVVGGLPAMVLGLSFASANAPHGLEGLLILVVGAVLGLAGARMGRRFTAWFWTAGVGVGLVVILVSVVQHHDTAAGILLIVIGLLVVGIASVAASALREPDETVPTRRSAG